MSGGRSILDYFGRFNVIEAVIGFVEAVRYKDLEGYKITLPRFEFEDVQEKYGDHHWSMRDVEAVLNAYRIPTYAYGFDENETWVHVPQRQARFAEYLLLRAGAPVIMDTVDGRNAGWAGNPAHGGEMPARWDDRE